MTKRSVVVCVALVVLWAGSAAGQDSLGERHSLVINEIMPNPDGGQCPWIELYNPTTEDVDLSEFFIRAGGSPEVGVASQPTILPRNEYFVVCFRWGSCSGCVDGNPARENPVEVPEGFAERWAPAANDVALEYDPDGVHGPRTVPVDYVAWGRPGRSWSQSIRSSLWPGRGFVDLEDHFGVRDRAEIFPAGSSIGRYPGSSVSTPDDWALYDTAEVALSRGRGNPIPRPKRPTLPDGATVSSRSIVFSWRQFRGDDTYRLTVYSQDDPGVAVIDRVLTTSIARVGADLPAGDYRYELRTIADGETSALSTSVSFVVANTECDWPLPSRITAGVSAAGYTWYPDPVCGTLSVCNRVESYRFSFQRKDTYLRCATGGCVNDLSDACHERSPQSHCISYVLPGTGAAPILCNGPENSSTCRRVPTLKLMSAGIPVPYGFLAYSPTTIHWGGSEHGCPHGKQYCLMASISMVASAYGACLSQDRIAYHICQRKGDHGCKRLMHEQSVARLHAAETLKWALWIPDVLLEIDPFVFSTLGVFVYLDEFVAAQFLPKTKPLISFKMLKLWIDEDRPVMALDGSHYHVVAGYCRDTANKEWVLQLDPWFGPKAELFSDWIVSVATLPPIYVDEEPIEQAVWVGPPINGWTGVEMDEATVWNDADGDGSRDLDEARFGTDPNDPSDF